jgi:hypothetical protein
MRIGVSNPTAQKAKGSAYLLLRRTRVTHDEIARVTCSRLNPGLV